MVNQHCSKTSSRNGKEPEISKFFGRYKEKDFSKQYTPEDAIKANLAIPQEDVTANIFDVNDNDNSFYNDNDNNNLDITSLLIRQGAVQTDYYDGKGNIIIQGFLLKQLAALFGVSDSRADSTILGQLAKIIKRTGQYAQILGYDSAAELSDLFPICSGYL